MSNKIISLRDVSLEISHENGRSLREIFTGKNKSSKEKKLLLKDISFDVLEGEKVAILGENGSGKTTLARLMSGIILPTKGSNQSFGEVRYVSDSTPEIDTNLTGHENAKFLARIFYPRKSNLDLKLKSALKFTELNEALEAPMRTYSLGMKRRLFFALQTLYPADLIIFDELSNNMDIFFNEKIDVYLEEYKRKLRSQIWISHDNDFLRKHCDRGIVIKEGMVVFDGDIDRAISSYTTR